jgi:hypothetical protein
MSNLKEKFLSLKGYERKEFFNKLKSYVYVYCEIEENNKRLPVYIGKGKQGRCLSHLDNLNDTSISKNRKIKTLLDEKKLGIDILAFGIDDKTALAIESACIDLMGIDNLTNQIRGKGDNVKRISISELSSLILDKPVKVKPEHSGCAILINRDYKSTFGDLEIFEYTRGIWTKGMKTIAGDSKYAYATFKGVVKEVYEIHSWVPAGSQEYFTRVLDPKKVNERWEFVGRKAPEEVRKRYVGKLIEKPQSQGNPFVKVGTT